MSLDPVADCERVIRDVLAEFTCFFEEKKDRECRYEQKKSTHDVGERVRVFFHPVDAISTSYEGTRTKDSGIGSHGIS